MTKNFIDTEKTIEVCQVTTSTVEAELWLDSDYKSEDLSELHESGSLILPDMHRCGDEEWDSSIYHTDEDGAQTLIGELKVLDYLTEEDVTLTLVDRD